MAAFALLSGLGLAFGIGFLAGFLTVVNYLGRHLNPKLAEAVVARLNEVNARRKFFWQK